MTDARQDAAGRTAALKTVVARMASDPAFAARVKEDPQGVAAEYGLDPSQIAMVSGATVDTRSRTHQRLEERLSRSALVFGGDMGGGDSGDSGDSGGSDSGSDSGGSDSDSGSSSSSSDDSGSSSSSSSSSSEDSSSSSSESDDGSGSDSDSSDSDSSSRHESTRSETTTREPAQPAASGPAAPESAPGQAMPGQAGPAAPAVDPLAPGPVGAAGPVFGGPVASPTDFPAGPAAAAGPVETSGPWTNAPTDDTWFDMPAGDGQDDGGDPVAVERMDPGGNGPFADGAFDDPFSDVDDQDADADADPDSDADSDTEADQDPAGDDVQDVAETGVVGPVVAPSFGAPSPLGYHAPSGEPNAGYHGGQVREQVVTRNADGTGSSVVVYDDGTTGTLERTIDAEGKLTEEITQDDGTVSTTTWGDLQSTTFIGEPDDSGTVRHVDYDMRSMTEMDVDADGARRDIEWTGAASEPGAGSGLFTVDSLDPDGELLSTTVVSATEDGGAVAFVVDADGNSVTARLDVSEIDNADGTVSRTYLFPDGRAETFTFDGATPIAHDGLPGVDGVPEEPPQQGLVPAAERYHGGEVSSQPIDVNPDGSGTYLVHYADGQTVEVTREIGPDGSPMTDRYIDEDGTRVVSSVGDGRGAALYTTPDGTNIVRNWDFETLRETEIEPDGDTTATAYTASREPAAGDLLFSTDDTALGGAAGPSTLVFATSDGGARAVVALPDGSNQTVRLQVGEVENIDGTTTRVFSFPDGRTESFTFNSAGAPVSHQAFDAPGPPGLPFPDDPFLEDVLNPDRDPDPEDIRRTLDDLLGGLPNGGGDSAAGIADLLSGALEPGPDGQPATGPLADLARVLGGGQPLGDDAGALGEDGPLPGEPGGHGLGVDLPPGHYPGGLLPGGFDIGGDPADPGEAGEPVVETSTGPDGSEITTTTQPDGTTTEVAFAPDGTATTTTTTPDGVTTVVDTETDGTLSRTVVQPDGSSTTETQSPDGARAVSAQTVDGRTVGQETFPDGSSRSTVFDPSTGNVTERTTFPGTGSTVVVTEPDGSVSTTTRLEDGTTQTSFTADGVFHGTTTFPNGDVEVIEGDLETDAKTITRSEASGFTSTDTYDPAAETWTRSSGTPGGPTTVEVFTLGGEVISREVYGPDGVPIPSSEPVVPPIVPDLGGFPGGGEPEPGPAEPGRWIPGYAGPVWVPAGGFDSGAAGGGWEGGQGEPTPSDWPLPPEDLRGGAEGPAGPAEGGDPGVPPFDPEPLPGTQPVLEVSPEDLEEAGRQLGGLARDADPGWETPDLGMPDPTDPGAWSDVDVRNFYAGGTVEPPPDDFWYDEAPDQPSTAWGPAAAEGEVPEYAGIGVDGRGGQPTAAPLAPFGQAGSAADMMAGIGDFTEARDPGEGVDFSGVDYGGMAPRAASALDGVADRLVEGTEVEGGGVGSVGERVVEAGVYSTGPESERPAGDMGAAWLEEQGS